MFGVHINYLVVLRTAEVEVWSLNPVLGNLIVGWDSI